MRIRLNFIPLILGICAAVFILPVSSVGAFVAFGLVQIIWGLRGAGKRPTKDRFRESLRTAERVLDGIN